MTRCPCTKSVCKPGTSFFYKVLASLKQLQCQKKYGNGAGLDAITKFMDNTYNLSGDIVSQVENALCSAECSRFVVKKKNVYALVCPAAALQFTPSLCIKAKLERIQQIFNSKWCRDNKGTKGSSNRKTRRNSYSPPHFIPPKDTNDSPTTTNVCDLENNKTRASLRQSDDTSTESPLKSYLKSFKFCKCSPNSSNNLINSRRLQNSSKEKRDPCSTSSRGYSKRKRRSCKLTRPKKKKRVCTPPHDSSKTNISTPCPTSSDESDSESSECESV